MIAWKQSYKPAEIAQIASYVLTLQGTTPAEPKEPEGEIWVDENSESTLETNTQVTDSTAVEMN